jgi:hypothetical protein
MLNQGNFDYGITSRSNVHDRNSLLFMEACYMAGDSVLAAKVAASVRKDLDQQIRYYNSLTGDRADAMSEERRTAENYLKGLEQMQTMYNPRIQIPGKMMAAPADSGKDVKDNTSKKK